MNKEKFLTEVMAALAEVLSKPLSKIALHEPTFLGNEWAYVKSCIDTGFVSSVGKFVDRFERELATFTGAKFAVATVNGTAALHLCLRLAEVRPGDEVIIPDLTFISTANAVSYCGAIPHLVDVSERTLGLDPLLLSFHLKKIAEIKSDGSWNRQTGRRIRAVVPMHTFGHPVDLDPLVKLCTEYKLELVEDAAESIGSYYKGRHTGNFGKLAACSFNGNKIITTGGGGAILTNDEQIAKMAKHLTTVAKVPHRYEFHHDDIGFNYRMPNINAALGVAQLEQLPNLLFAKRKLAKAYENAFQNVKSVRFFKEPQFSRSNYWLNVLTLEESASQYFIDLLEYTNDNGIMTRPFWTPLHQQVMYKNCPHADLTVSERLAKRAINIPSSSFLWRKNG